MDVLNDRGELVAVSFTVAAEWVGISCERHDEGETVRFLPGGVAHAYDPASEQTLCGFERELEHFAMDFVADAWLYRCATCREVAASTNAD